MISRFLFTAGALFAFSAFTARADGAALPGDGYNASRYEVLWTKSPFSVATAEAAQTSPDYTLVGIAQCDGISYASLVDKQSNEHFLLASNDPIRGLTLLSVTRAADASTPASVVLQRNGETIDLKVEQVAAPPPPPQPMAGILNHAPGYAAPGQPNYLPPGQPTRANGTFSPGQMPQPIMRRHLIHLPRPGFSGQAPQPGTPAPPPQTY